MKIPIYLVPGDNESTRAAQKTFWDAVYSDIVNNLKYDKLCDILSELKDLTLAIVPNRSDLHREFLEHVDIEFFKQQFEHNVFTHTNFIELFTYWIHWTKKFGAPEDDKKMDLLLETIIKEVEDKGYLYILPTAYYYLYSQLDSIYTTVQNIKKDLQNKK